MKFEVGEIYVFSLKTKKCEVGTVKYEVGAIMCDL